LRRGRESERARERMSYPSVENLRHRPIARSLALFFAPLLISLSLALSLPLSFSLSLPPSSSPPWRASALITEAYDVRISFYRQRSSLVKSSEQERQRESKREREAPDCQCSHLGPLALYCTADTLLNASCLSSLVRKLAVGVILATAIPKHLLHFHPSFYSFQQRLVLAHIKHGGCHRGASLCQDKGC